MGGCAVCDNDGSRRKTVWNVGKAERKDGDEFVYVSAFSPTSVSTIFVTPVSVSPSPAVTPVPISIHAKQMEITQLQNIKQEFTPVSHSLPVSHDGVNLTPRSPLDMAQMAPNVAGAPWQLSCIDQSVVEHKPAIAISVGSFPAPTYFEAGSFPSAASTLNEDSTVSASVSPAMSPANRLLPRPSNLMREGSADSATKWSVKRVEEELQEMAQETARLTLITIPAISSTLNEDAIDDEANTLLSPASNLMREGSANSPSKWSAKRVVEELHEMSQETARLMASPHISESSGDTTGYID